MHDDLRVTSELYRLRSPRPAQRSELREALDAATGIGGGPGDLAADDGHPPQSRPRLVLPAAVRAASRRTLAWLGGLATAVLTAVIAALIITSLPHH